MKQLRKRSKKERKFLKERAYYNRGTSKKRKQDGETNGTRVSGKVRQSDD